MRLVESGITVSQLAALSRALGGKNIPRLTQLCKQLTDVEGKA
jgi:hypothetical protein